MGVSWILMVEGVIVSCQWFLHLTFILCFAIKSIFIWFKVYSSGDDLWADTDVYLIYRVEYNWISHPKTHPHGECQK